MDTSENNDDDKDMIDILKESENSDISELKDNEIIGHDGEVVTLDKGDAKV